MALEGGQAIFARPNWEDEDAARVDRVRSYFDQAADSYVARYRDDSLGGYGFRVRKQRVLELIGRGGGKVLDVGCGPGIMVPELIERGFEFWGVDVSPRMIELCRGSFGHLQRAHFSVGDAMKLQFPDASFERVVCMGVIDRVPRYEASIREMHRVLKPGGSCIVTFPNLYSPTEAWRRFVYNPAIDLLKRTYAIATRRATPLPLSSFVRMHTAGAASRILLRHFDEIPDVVYFNFEVVPSPCDQLFPRLTRRVAERLESQARGPLRWLGTGFIVTCVKRK